jgi:hypothetical protein
MTWPYRLSVRRWIVSELARHVDNASTLVEEQRHKVAAQVVRASMREAGRVDGAAELPATPGLVSSQGPRATILARKHKLMVVWTAGRHSPGSKVCRKRPQQSHRAVASLGVSFLS